MDSEEDLYGLEEVEETDGYTILSEERIKQLQEKDISEVCNSLCVSRGTACALLLGENWSVTSVIETWLAGGVRGVMETPKSKLIEPDNYCKMCLERVENDSVLCLQPCGHRFCADCWRSYFSVNINNGAGCLNLPCPEPNCKTPAGLDVVELVSSDDDKNKYYNYLYRSYIECSSNRKWCPARGCKFAVEFAVGSSSSSYDVTCHCSYKFCWNCGEECHRPVDCQMALNWIKKMEFANSEWISAYTKPCPKCQRPIEKNYGCNNMTCVAPCGYQFCWLCLEPWELPGHSSKLSCHKFEKERGKVSSLVMNARTELINYLHYQNEWISNNLSREIALAQMSRARTELIPVLCKVGETKNVLHALQCMLDAWEQIAECRRVLKWSYAYEYYMDADDKVKKTFFKFLQAEAESSLKRLHHCVEKEMEKYVEADGPCEDFSDFRTRLTRLTGVTRTYFQNLVRAIEYKLCEVVGSTAFF